jgi:rubrerythrin
MQKYTIEEVIEQAIQTEILGNQFYSGMAEKFKDNAALTSLFDDLAAKELKHKATFIELKAAAPTTEPENWDEVSMYLRAMVESEFFLGKHKALPSMPAITTVADAVRFAIGFEKDTLLYFIGLRDVVPQRVIVDAIINEEKSHIRDLAAFLVRCCT